MDKADVFPENLKAIRKAKKMGQEELASHSGLDKGTISRLERGVQTPRRSNIRALAEALDCKPTDLTGTGRLYSEIMAQAPEEPLLRAQLKSAEGEIGDLKKLNRMTLQAVELLEEKLAEANAVIQSVPGDVWRSWEKADKDSQLLSLWLLTWKDEYFHEIPKNLWKRLHQLGALKPKYRASKTKE